jgi:nucleotide-binding universal stress UspA family protein
MGPQPATRDDGDARPAIRRIVLATDLTPGARAAHAFASALARAFEAELCVLYVVPEPVLPAGMLRQSGIGVGEVLERCVGEAERRLHRVQEWLEPPPAQTIIRLGTAEDEITRCAHAMAADVIVVGGPPAGGGSPSADVGQTVRQRARCPVITVPHHDAAEGDATPQPALGGGGILVASDFSPHARAALRMAETLAGRLACPLHVVHVGQAPTARVPREWLVRSGDPATEIMACARELGAGLIVLGTHGRGPVRRALLGSVAREVVAQAPCPTMTLRRRRDTPRAGVQLTWGPKVTPMPSTRSIASAQPARQTATARPA